MRNTKKHIAKRRKLQKKRSQNKTMKKILSIALAAIMALSVICIFASCSKSGTKVKVIDSRADQIFLNPDNSGIEVKNLESGDITFLTDMGTINGTIKGKQEDWAITSRAEGLFNSLPEFQSGEKPLLAVASEGSIRLSFLG